MVYVTGKNFGLLEKFASDIENGQKPGYVIPDRSCDARFATSEEDTYSEYIDTDHVPALLLSSTHWEPREKCYTHAMILVSCEMPSLQ